MSTCPIVTRRLGLPCPVVLFICVITVGVTVAFGVNPTVLENSKEGTEDWRLDSVKLDFQSGEGLRSKVIEGYASKASLYPGESIDFHVSTSPAADYQIDIFRTGYYGGTGGRHVLHIDSHSGQTQRVPSSGRGRVRECEWPVSVSLKIPDDWASGVYLTKLSRLDDGNQSYIVFIVKRRGPADLLVQCSDLTWQAYNKWPGRDSLYDDGIRQNRFNEYLYTGDETRVSLDRPYALYGQLQKVPETIGSGTYLLTEFPLVYFLEREGYDVAYCSNLDVDGDSAVINEVGVFLSVGHDEYWTGQSLRNVAVAREKGVSLAFLSGNALLHEVGMEPSSGTGAENRVFSRVASMRTSGRDLMGSTTYGPGLGDWVVRSADHWIFTGTGLQNGDSIVGLVGWEYHGQPVATHAGLSVIASAPLRSYWSGQDLQFDSVVYPTNTGGWVMNAGTIWWSQGLSSPPGHVTGASSEARTMGVDDRVQQITRNFLERCLENRVSGRPVSQGN